jgi:hypothetical protein
LGIRIAAAHRTATLNTAHRRLPPHARPLHLVAAHVLAVLATLRSHPLAERLPLAAHVLAMLATLCAHLHALAAPHTLTATHVAATLPKSDGCR